LGTFFNLFVFYLQVDIVSPSLFNASLLLVLTVMIRVYPSRYSSGSNEYSANMTVGQSSLTSLAHHCYDWHPGSRCGSIFYQL